MKNIKNFRGHVKKKPVILYLHGLDGDLNNKYRSMLNDLGFNYIGLSVDYRNDPDILKILIDMKIDGVIGHSLGGYLAYHLSNIKKIPALLLMPSFDDDDIKHIKIPGEYRGSKLFSDKLILIGKDDDAVDRSKQMDSLKNLNIQEENIGHDLSDTLFKKYLKKFIGRYFSNIN